MPELPEAETIVRDLAGSVAGRTITGVDVVHPDVLAPTRPAELAAAVIGRRIESVTRRGKNVVFLLVAGNEHQVHRGGSPGAGGNPSSRKPHGATSHTASSPDYTSTEPLRLRLVVNLGMTGRLVAAAGPDAPGCTHVAVRFRFDGGRSLLYDDVRRFGRLELLDDAGWRRRDGELGIEPLSRALTPTRLHEMLGASRTPVRNWLLDQRRIAGVGNIYANEALFRARIRPDRPANTLSAEDARRLRDALRTVLRSAIAARGTTVSDYRDGNGLPGGFEPQLQVYGREGRPCPRCGTPIVRQVLTNRSAFSCPRCQS